MTDNKIIKALELHLSTSLVDCKECPLYYHKIKLNDCQNVLYKNALDLIKRQKTENEELTTLCDMQDKNMLEQKAEIERLQDSNRRLKDDMRMMLNNDNGSEQIRAEAIKEFWEKLKEKSEFLKDDDDYIGYAECVRVCYGDNLVKRIGG